MEVPYTRIYAQVDLDRIAENMESMAANLPLGTKIIGVVKTDGYGHGSVPVARVIDPYVWGYATATLEEGEILREHGIVKPVLVLGPVHESRYQELIDYGIRPSIFQLSKAEKLSKLAVKSKKPAVIHLAVDTGMSRIGFAPTGECADEAERISRLPGIVIEGLFTHFARADETDKSGAIRQFSVYRTFLSLLESRGVEIPVKHCANSAAILDLTDMSLDAVRAGIAIYGLYPSGEVERARTPLYPAMSLYSFITYIKEIEAGTAVSYGGTFVADRRMRIATVGAGYGDGYPRNLSGKGEVLIRGKRAPILGRVCMDQFMVDVSHIPEAAEDDRVTLLGRDGDECVTMEELARICGGFHYEIPCVLGKRVPRVYIRNGSVVGAKDYHRDRYGDF